MSLNANLYLSVCLFGSSLFRASILHLSRLESIQKASGKHSEHTKAALREHVERTHSESILRALRVHQGSNKRAWGESMGKEHGERAWEKSLGREHGKRALGESNSRAWGES